jgi:hypothetical protein
LLAAALLPTVVPAWQVWRTDLTRWNFSSYREVANALITVRKLAEARLELEKGVLALRNM